MALIAFVLRKVDWVALGAVLRGIDWLWASVGSACTLLLIGGLAARWNLFLLQQDLRVPYATVFRLTWTGQFFNSILPGSTGGDVYKLLEVCRLAPERKAAAASTVFVDRVSALFTLLVLAGSALLLDPRAFGLLPRLNLPWELVTVFSLFAVALTAATLLLLKRTTRGRGWYHLGWQFYGRVLRTLTAARANLRLNFNTVVALVLALVIHLLNFFIVYLLARALHIPLTYGQVCLMMPVVLLVVMAPITINGHGLREIVLIGYFGYLGVTAAGQADTRETVIALSLLLVSNDLLWSLPGGLFHLWRFRGVPPPGLPEP